MYKCENCNKLFEDALEIQDTYENYYGVSEWFGDSHRMIYYVCPYCNSEYYDEVYEDDDQEDE